MPNCQKQLNDERFVAGNVTITNRIHPITENLIENWQGLPWKKTSSS